MDVLWDGREMTVREVAAEVNARHDRPRAYTTIMTVMVRLAAKGLLRRRRRGRADLYEPTLDRAAYREARAAARVDALVDDLGDVALVHFSRHVERLDPERLEQLRRLARDE